jgi:hypothetical protein
MHILLKANEYICAVQLVINTIVLQAAP